jgi:hypothetical protein
MTYPQDDLWIDQPKGELSITPYDDRPGSIDGRQVKELRWIARRHQGTAYILAAAEQTLGRQILKIEQLSRLEADHLIKALTAQQEAQTDG